MGAAVNNTPWNKRQTRRSRVEGCSICATDPERKQMMPPHDASTRCESGSHTHCSCDTCF